jgi:hypothetical protein
LSAPAIKVLQERAADLRWVLDSGAFTAWKAGKPIALDDYCRFLETLPVQPWRYFTLDVIGDPHASLKNYETMLARGFTPVPIFTRGESLDMLDEYYKTSDLVGVGGLVGTNGNKGFVNGVMKRIAGRKVHLLGFTNLEYISVYRPYMCDSSSWASAMQYASIKLYAHGKVVAVSKKDFVKPPSPRILALFAEMGLEARALARKEQWVNTGRGENMIEKVAFRSFTRHQLEVRQHLGTHLFMAVASDWQIRCAHDAFCFWRDQRPALCA